MKFRTLTQFRAEYGIRLSELSEKLDIPYNELEQIENSDVVPSDIAEKITEYYGLSNTYFTENIGAPPKAHALKLKKTPQKPFTYFLKLYWIYYLIYLAATYLIKMPRLISISVFSMMGGESIWENPIFSFLALIGDVLIIVLPAVGCIVLSKHIPRATTFTGEISKYKYLWYLLPLWLMRPFNYVTSLIGNRFPPDISSYNSFALYYLQILVSFLVSLILELLASLLYAAVLTAVTSDDEIKRNKTVKYMCIFTIVSQIAYILIFVLFQFLDTPAMVHIFVWNIIKTVICIVIPAGLLLKSRFTPKLERLWCTALPLAYFAASAVYIIIDSILP